MAEPTTKQPSSTLSRRMQNQLRRGEPGNHDPNLDAISLDSLIEQMAQKQLGDVVGLQEGTNRKMVYWASDRGLNTAAQFLVCRLFTDAIFNSDIRCIQTIINRVDGGLPKDSEVSLYRTSFADAVAELMTMTEADQLKVYPDDTVMMALAKSLYDIACEDIYWDEFEGCKKKPSDTKKQLRDNAMRMILERAGGRKTKVELTEEKETIELSPWVQRALT